MNSQHRVLKFTLISIGIYFILSILDLSFNFPVPAFRKVNLIADLVKSPQIKDSIVVVKEIPFSAKKDESPSTRVFEQFKAPKTIIRFSADTNQPALQKFLPKLMALKSGTKQKLRIAYFGDSMIEGDLLTETLRALLQKEFGGSGVGFVPITSQVSSFRRTVSHTYSKGWEDENFRNTTKGNVYFSGHLFRGKDDWVSMTDQTIRDSAAILEKSLLCGPVSEPFSIMVNGTAQDIYPKELFNRIPIRKDRSRNLRLVVTDDRLPVYGISFETDNGITVDNFSFRGITGIELNKLDIDFLHAIGEQNPYDLMIFQYGVNVLFRPNDKNFSWYGNKFQSMLVKMKKAFPDTEMMLVSAADRAFRYDGTYSSAVGIDSLIKMQANIAFETGMAFYNQYETMGGKNSIVRWAAEQPSLANKDYVHPNGRGAAKLGTFLFEAFLKDYYKYQKLHPKS